ncbi:Aldo keto reductase [Marasmius fiardii PR-910]|nr:Aldo keto reductase [Marasmius fiardii PR-910]
MPANCKKSLKLNTGAEIPVIGLGTWKSEPGTVEKAVSYALQNGYTHIDTATNYGNEAEVGKGIKASGVLRPSIHVTTKLNNPDMGKGKVEKALRNSLVQLDTDYLDLWLMHWPAPTNEDMNADKSVDWLDTWHEMERLHKENPERLRAIGVSNFSEPYLERLLSNSKVVPAVNQIELHPGCPQQSVIDFCKKKGIAVFGYSPLGSDDSPLFENQVVKEISEKHNETPNTILISLQANRDNVGVIVKSANEERIADNLKIIELSKEEIDTLNDTTKIKPFRAVQPTMFGWGDLGFKKGVE